MLYKRGLHTDQTSNDLMIGVASWFYKRVHDSYLECLIKEVWKLKKPMDDQNIRASDRCQKEKKKCTHGEMLRGHFD
jgi:hypothetical protein